MSKIRILTSYLPIILAFILGDVVCDNLIFRSFRTQTENSPIISEESFGKKTKISDFSSASNGSLPSEKTTENLSSSTEADSLQFFLFLGALLLQTIAAPIQAAFSDLYCRKKSLLISLVLSLVSLAILYLYDQKVWFSLSTLLLIIFLKCSFGNTTPLAWAAVADTQNKNFRFSFGLSTSAYAIAYLLLILSNKALTSDQSILSSLFVFAALVLLCLFLFKDIRDEVPSFQKEKTKRKPNISSAIKNEISLIFKDLRKGYIKKSLLSFLLWEISLYVILLLYVDFDVATFSFTAVAISCGYLFGIAILKIFPRITDKKMIVFGYNFSSISLLPIFIIVPFISEGHPTLLALCYFFHALGNALLCSTIFALLSKVTPIHEQGRLYGLIASADTIAFLIASLAIILYNHFQLHFLYIVIFSFLTVSISWFPYKRFEKIRPSDLPK